MSDLTVSINQLRSELDPYLDELWAVEGSLKTHARSELPVTAGECHGLSAIVGRAVQAIFDATDPVWRKQQVDDA